MGFSWNALDKKRKIIFVASIAVMILTVGVIIYEILIWIDARVPIIDRRFPIWDSNPKVNRGFVLLLHLEKDESPYPLHFPEVTTDLHDDIPEAYPAAYCQKCGKLFAFITREYKPGMKPDKCPLCGNSDPSALIVLEDDKQILDYNLRSSFDLYWDDSHLEKLEWFDKDGSLQFDEKGRCLTLLDYWKELQKNRP